MYLNINIHILKKMIIMLTYENISIFSVYIYNHHPSQIYRQLTCTEAGFSITDIEFHVDLFQDPG